MMTRKLPTRNVVRHWWESVTTESQKQAVHGELKSHCGEPHAQAVGAGQEDGPALPGQSLRERREAIEQHSGIV